MNPNTSDVVGEEAAIIAAFDTWENDPLSHADFRYDGATTLACRAFDGTQAVYWTSSGCPTGNCGNFLACTDSWINNAAVYHFDIEFNDNLSWALGAVSGKYDIQSVAVHEAGHTLNLKHPIDCSQVMGIASAGPPAVGCLPTNATRRTLGSGDLNGVRVLYPMQHLTSYELARTRSGDFNGGGKSDIATWRPSTGEWNIAYQEGGHTTILWGAPVDIPVTGDFNGGGKTDIVAWSPATGNWQIRYSEGGSVTYGWGAGDHIPVPGDYNGLGKTDLAVWKPSTGEWFIAYLETGTTEVLSWGASNHTPVPGDYNGGGKTDLAVWQPSNGTWYIAYREGGNAQVQWGASDHIPVPGDYNGGGKTDITTWRPSAGTWHIAYQEGGDTTIPWGASDHIPGPGDYNGGGKTDIVTWRPSTGDWHIAYQEGGNTTIQWGASDHIPIAGRHSR